MHIDLSFTKAFKPFSTKLSMHYHIILTELCNSQCKYCYERSLSDIDSPINEKLKLNFEVPERSEIDVNKLKEFLSRDPNAVLIFYGGEPLLEIEKIKEIMDKIDVPFRMQTKGNLLNRLPAEYVNRIGKILVSLDGSKERTDLNRGAGTYDLVTKNLKLIKKNGYDGEIVARMAIDFSDVYEQVLALLDAGFTSIHWQLTAGFFASDYNYEKFKRFSEEYNKSLSQLINFWISEIKKGRVLKLYPFLGILHSLLHNEKTLMRCGAGHSGYALSTDGKIVACPIMNGVNDFIAGDLESNPSKFKKFEVSNRCKNCEEYSLCGGRCLYWNVAQPWPEEGDELICSSVKHLIKELKNNMRIVQKAIAEGVIKIEDFDYEKYFGPEIIP